MIVGLRWRGRVYLLAALLTLGVGSSLQAHGGGTPQLTGAEAGPYRIFAWTEPEPWRVGEAHVSVMVTLGPRPGVAEDERAAAERLDEPVNDAAVHVILTPLAGGQAIVAETELQALGGNISYEADTVLPTAGTWQVDVVVDAALGSGDAAFVVEALPARTLNPWVLGGGALTALALIAMIGMRGRAKNRERRI